jgi:hypothetical protein
MIRELGSIHLRRRIEVIRGARCGDGLGAGDAAEAIAWKYAAAKHAEDRAKEPAGALRPFFSQASGCRPRGFAAACAARRDANARTLQYAGHAPILLCGLRAASGGKVIFGFDAR